MSESIFRIGDYSTGHQCWPPRECKTGSSNVFANGIGIVRVGDDYATSHPCNGISYTTHGLGEAIAGSPTVYSEGKPVHRTGDLVSCGDTAGAGSTNVKCG